MPNFGIFRRSRKESVAKETPETPVNPETPATNPTCESNEPVVRAEVTEPEVKVSESKAYLKAMPLRDLADLEAVKKEINGGNILILRITPLASKSIEDVKQAVNDLSQFAESIGGDIARLGEERVVLTPPKIRIWREKTQVAAEPLPTAA